MSGLVQSIGSGVIRTAQVAVGTAATQLVGQNGTRSRILISNPAAGSNIFVGPDAGVTATNGLLIATGTSQAIQYVGQLFAITAAGNATISVLEEVNQ